MDDLNNMDNRIQLTVMGISYNPVQNGAFALLLAQTDGPIRIPVIIGAPEAQAIAIRMEGVHPPRPLTHDLFASFSQAFGVELVEVFIHKFEDGVFYSEMTFRQGERTVVMDARTSDAVAVAMRTGAPIFTTQEILLTTGIEIDDDPTAEGQPDNPSPQTNRQPKPENLALPELEKMLQTLIADEDYEQAAFISSIIKAKKQAQKSAPGTNENATHDNDDNTCDDNTNEEK